MNLENQTKQDTSYIEDAFTKTGESVNLEVDNLNVTCITSKNNKFSLDQDGNLTVNTINNLSTTINNQAICDMIYPVGSIYLSTGNTNPTLLFGGTWELIKDHFLLGDGDIYHAGDMGGESIHTLTVDEMPKHFHNIINTNSWGVPAQSGIRFNLDINATRQGVNPSEETGGSQPHNNMPPYLVIYMWKRTS